MPRLTQCDRILRHLKSGRTLTAADAFTMFGVSRLAARIHELREAGHPIEAGAKTVTNRFGEDVTVAVYRYPGQAELFGVDADAQTGETR